MIYLPALLALTFASGCGGPEHTSPMDPMNPDNSIGFISVAEAGGKIWFGRDDESGKLFAMTRRYLGIYDPSSDEMGWIPIVHIPYASIKAENGCGSGRARDL
jgi:hypothetical protein